MGWAGFAVTALLATPPLILWFGITHGFWVTVTVQTALCAAPLLIPLALQVPRRLRRRKSEPEMHRPVATGSVHDLR